MRKSKVTAGVVLLMMTMVVVVVVGSRAGAQQIPAPTAADLQKFNDEFMAAWAKGDATTVGSRYTTDAIRIGSDNQISQGRAAIAKWFADGFAGASKGSTITLKNEHTVAVSPTTMVVSGTYEVRGGSQPRAGRFVNTMVRQMDTWMIAASAVIPNQPAAR